MMKINVGTHNPLKVRATRNVLEKIYSRVNVDGIEVDSGVRDQPMGLDETIQGAMNRARNAFMDVDLAVGIESGFLETPHSLTGYLDLQWCAIYDGDRFTLGVSSGFEYPPAVAEEVLKGREVGEVMDQITGVEKLGQKSGAVSYLTRGLLDRTENTEQCVLMAMIPRINKGVYFADR
jgi:inosine/xanthosine triphosphatase